MTLQLLGKNIELLFRLQKAFQIIEIKDNLNINLRKEL